jgi:hypothetical protein
MRKTRGKLVMVMIMAMVMVMVMRGHGQPIHPVYMYVRILFAKDGGAPRQKSISNEKSSPNKRCEKRQRELGDHYPINPSTGCSDPSYFSTIMSE